MYYIDISKKEEGMQHKEEEKRHIPAQKAFPRPFAASEVETLVTLKQRQCNVPFQEKAVHVSKVIYIALEVIY